MAIMFQKENTLYCFSSPAVASGTDYKEHDPTATAQGGFHKPSSGKERTLQSVKTYIYVGTEVRHI